MNSTYKGVMRVPHGCHGSPTLKVRIRIPEGVIAIKPMPKAGWQLETVKGKYTRTYDYFGTPMAEGVQEIVWTGKLLDEHYDEFVFRSWLTDSLKPDTTFTSRPFRNARMVRRSVGSRYRRRVRPEAITNFRRPA